MLLIKLKSRFSSELIRVFAVKILKHKRNYSVELASLTDTDKLEESGFEPSFETLVLGDDEFLEYVVSIENVG